MLHQAYVASFHVVLTYNAENYSKTYAQFYNLFYFIYKTNVFMRISTAS